MSKSVSKNALGNESHKFQIRIYTEDPKVKSPQTKSGQNPPGNTQRDKELDGLGLQKVH